jgi:hypothetical protein
LGYLCGGCFFRSHELLHIAQYTVGGEALHHGVARTGNLQKSAKMLYKVARGHKISDPDALAAQIAAMVVLGTLFGAISGGVALAYEVNVPLMLLPAGAGQCAVLLWHDHLLRPRFNQPSAALLEPLTDAGGGAKKAGPETATTSSTASWSRFSLSS